MTAPTTEPSAAAQLDTLPITRFHIFVLVLCSLGLAFDLYEIGIGSAFGAVFSRPPHEVSPQTLAWLLSSVYVGAVVGSSAGGWLADRFGRRIVLICMLWLLAVTAGVAAASPDVRLLTASRMVMGLTLGAFPPLIIAYLTDLMPVAHRGRLIFFTMAFAFLGAPAGVFIIRTMTPLEFLGMSGWRWSLVVGAVGAAVCALAFRRLPESPRWLEATGRKHEAFAALQRFTASSVVIAGKAVEPSIAMRPQASATEPVVADSLRIRFLKYASLCFLSPWSSGAFPLLTGAILTQKGFRLSDTLFYVGLSTFGQPLGTLLAAFAVDKFDRRTGLAACAVVMLLSCAAFAYTDVPAWLVISSTLFSMCAAVFVPLQNMYGSEIFETKVRASAVTGAWAFNRFGAAMAPLLLVPLMRSGGVPAAMAVIGATLMACIVLLALSAPGRSRRAVD